MATRVGVGLDQYVVANKQIELVTSGLIGCIGVSVTKGDHCFLSHVSFSDHQADYRTKIRHALEGFIFHCQNCLVSKTVKSKCMTLVYSGQEGLANLIRLNWIQGAFCSTSRGDTYREEQAAGVTQVYDGAIGWRLDFLTPISDNKHLFKPNYKQASSMPAGVIASGFLSGCGADASVSKHAR